MPKSCFYLEYNHCEFPFSYWGNITCFIGIPRGYTLPDTSKTLENCWASAPLSSQKEKSGIWEAPTSQKEQQGILGVRIWLPSWILISTLSLWASHECILSSDFFDMEILFETENQLTRVNYDCKGNQHYFIQRSSPLTSRVSGLNNELINIF